MKFIKYIKLQKKTYIDPFFLGWVAQLFFVFLRQYMGPLHLATFYEKFTI